MVGATNCDDLWRKYGLAWLSYDSGSEVHFPPIIKWICLVSYYLNLMFTSLEPTKLTEIPIGGGHRARADEGSRMNIQSSIEVDAMKPQSRIYFAQLAQFFSSISSFFRPSSTTTTSSSTSFTTETIFNTFFIQLCTPSPFSYQLCWKRQDSKPTIRPNRHSAFSGRF